MKAIKDFFKRFLSSKDPNDYQAVVLCSHCMEEIVVGIKKWSDFQDEYNPHNSKHAYTVKKEIIGKNCYSIMKLTIGLTRESGVLFAETESCKFIRFGKK